MAIIFFALGFILLLVATYMIWTMRHKVDKNQNWERPPIR